MEPFAVLVVRPGTVVLRCRGELDLLTRLPLASACCEAVLHDADLLVLDLAEVSFLDCGSVRMLEQTALDHVERGGRVLALCPDPFLLQVLEIGARRPPWAVVASAEAAALAAVRVAGPHES